MTAEVLKKSNSFNVFKPEKGPLLSRTALGNVFDLPSAERQSRRNKRPRKLLSDVPRPVDPPKDSGIVLPNQGSLLLEGPRAESRMRSRLGMQSQASFFIRHNPHPHRVRHIEGLNGFPVCAVHDHDHFLLPARISLPNSPQRVFQLSRYGQQSSPSAFQSYPYREKAVPMIGLIPMTESWRNELQELCSKAGLLINDPNSDPRSSSPLRSPTGKKAVYSEETGRLIPPPSRAMSRQSGRTPASAGQREHYNYASAYPDSETIMLEMLCQILQTDSVQAVQQWLVAASDREKAMVLDMIKVAMNPEHHLQEEQPPISSFPQSPPARAETSASLYEMDGLGNNESPRRNRMLRRSVTSQSRRSVTSQSNRSSISGAGRERSTPRERQKQGTFRFQKGTSPTKCDPLPKIEEGVTQTGGNEQ